MFGTVTFGVTWCSGVWFVGCWLWLLVYDCGLVVCYALVVCSRFDLCLRSNFVGWISGFCYCLVCFDFLGFGFLVVLL